MVNNLLPITTFDKQITNWISKTFLYNPDTKKILPRAFWNQPQVNIPKFKNGKEFSLWLDTIDGRKFQDDQLNMVMSFSGGIKTLPKGGVNTITKEFSSLLKNNADDVLTKIKSIPSNVKSLVTTPEVGNIIPETSALDDINNILQSSKNPEALKAMGITAKNETDAILTYQNLLDSNSNFTENLRKAYNFFAKREGKPLSTDVMWGNNPDNPLKGAIMRVENGIPNYSIFEKAKGILEEIQQATQKIKLQSKISPKVDNIANIPNSLQQEYNNKNSFQKMFTPKPVYAAENNDQESTNAQKIDNKQLITNALKEQGILTPNTLAYALATIDHETDGTFNPIEEYDGVNQAIKNQYDGGENYYGRGFIQLTGANNYRDIGQKLGMGNQLLENPNLALQPEIAAKILALFFKDKQINVTADRGDFVLARTRINGSDKADKIADLAKKYLPESTDIITTIKNKEDTNNFYNSAKQIQQEYNQRTQSDNPLLQWFKRATTVKPAFSAENNNQQSNQVEDINMGFLDNAKKTQGYGEKTFSFYGKGGHEGNDFRASIGTPVKGFAGWVVDFAGQGERYYGNKIVLRNPQTGEQVEFAHLKDIGVQKGQVLGNNQVIGTTGNSGYRPDGKSQEAHLHVNYYTPDSKKADFYKQAKNAGDNFPLVASVNSVIDKAKSIVSGITNPKQVQAEEPAATPVGTPVKEGQPNPQLTPEQDPNQPGAYYGKSQGSYQIKPGDTLGNIARQFNTTVQDFQRQNPNIVNPNIIRAGQSLNVPSAVTDTSRGDGYTIRSGDTLTSIAKNLGTTVNDLVRKNGIQNPNLIRAGAKIKV